MSAWVLPDHIADVLPSEARHIEELRRIWLDHARRCGYELVMPPMLEHLDSLLSDSDPSLNLQTFKLVDQLSGRTLGLRADTTVQVARIDAHLLNRKGVTRLCYCGPVLHTRADRPGATREPYQLGAEIYGHPGTEADLEILALALRGAKAAGLTRVVLDMGHARIVPALLEGLALEDGLVQALHIALGRKDAAEIGKLAHHLPAPVASALEALTRLYGDRSVLSSGRQVLSAWPQAVAALDQLAFLTDQLSDCDITFDLGDLNGYGYYSGLRFALYAHGAGDALLRGGRYDAVGAVFGRDRPAVGFSLDLKEWARCLPRPAQHAAIRAPWSEDTELRHAIDALRQQGETVVCVLPGHDSEADEFNCNRELVRHGAQWQVQPIHP